MSGATDDRHEAAKQTMSLVDRAIREYRLRRKRDEAFQTTIFGEPAWDMLLDLFIRQSSNQNTSAKAICLASYAPMSTAMRHLRALEREDFVLREPYVGDKRTTKVRLTERGLHALQRALGSTESV